MPPVRQRGPDTWLCIAAELIHTCIKLHVEKVSVSCIYGH